ncbi:MAG: FecR domain-containing protein [Pseudomonadota bacterium]
MSENLRFVLAVVAILVVGLVGYRLLFPPDDTMPLLVQAVEGTVQTIDGRGDRVEVSPGLVLGRSDRIETAADGRAFLSMGEGSTLTLDHESAIRVLAVTRDGVRVELDGGAVEATVRPERGRVGVVHGGREVSSDDGSFAVGVNAGGNLAVEAHIGEVSVQGVEAVQALQEGERLMLLADGTPQVASIPESLLLEVAWPESARTRHAEVAVRGQTDPGAEVRLGASGHWTTVTADATGHFEAAIPLLEGENPLRVVSRDPLGRSVETSHTVTRDSEPPAASSIEVQY